MIPSTTFCSRLVVCLDIRIVTVNYKFETMFQAGQSGNPKGRPPGSKNKVTLELFRIAKERGYKHPVLYLLEVVNDEKAAPERRDTCAIAAAPYMTHKMGTASLPRYLEEHVDVPTFNTVQEAEAYLAHIPVLLGRGEIDSQTALELSTLTKNWLDAIYARQGHDLKLQAQGGGDATIRISGGLPPLPGTTIDMRNELTATNGRVIDHTPEQDVVQAVIPAHGAPEPPKDPTEGLGD
jgi:hypothetical protein